MAEYITDKIEYGGNVYKFKEAVMQSKTFTGLIGSANDAAGASFYVGKIVPDSFTKPWSITFREYLYAAGQETNSQQWSTVHLEGRTTDYTSYWVFNSFYNTNYYSAYYTNYYSITQAGFNAGHGHLIGIGLRSSWNRTTAANARTITYEILDTQGCTFTFFDSALKYANVPGTGSTNYSVLREFNFTSAGLQETGDADQPNYRNRDYYACRVYKTASGRYKICFTQRDGKILPANATDNDTGTSKAMTTEAFDPFSPIWYHASTNIAAGTTNNSGYLHRQYGDLIDLRYSFNLNRSTTPYTLPTPYAPVYIVAVLQNDGTAKLDTTTPITQTLPTSDDGKIYIYFGNTYSDSVPYRANLDMHHPIYYYKNGALRQYSGDVKATYSAGTAIDINSSNEVSVNYGTGLALDDGNSLEVSFGTTATTAAKGNHTHTITAAVTDGVWDLTGTNGTNKVTYAVAPYPAATATSSWIKNSSNAGKFYLGANRTPYGSTRLNYNGILYAKDVYVGTSWSTVDQRLTSLEEQICLIEGTKIKMADGSEKNIEDVQTGDMVLSYNPAKAKQIPAMALKSVRTGVAKDFDVLVYENGNYAEMYQEHSIYDTALGYPHSHKEWNVGDEGLMVDGPSRLIRKTTSRHAIIKERFVLVTSTGLYYANGILMGIWPSTKYNITKHSCYGLNLPDAILNEFKREGELNDRSNTLEINPDFLSRSKTLQTTIYNLSKEIEDCKKNLLDTDYIVTKFTEGLISAAEWLKSKASRANWRSLINKDEGPLAEAMEQLEALKQQIKGDNPSLKDIYWESVTKANEMLPAFQEWFENWQKPEE